MSIGRMGTTATSQRYLADLRDANARLADVQRELATGRRISTPSDDPVGVALTMRLRSDSAAREAWSRNASDALSWLGATDDALAGVTDVIQRARELALRGANGTISSAQRAVVADEVESLRAGFVEIANTTLGGRFIFGGARTDQAPLDPTGAPTNGNTTVLNREIAQGELVRVNATVDEITGVVDVNGNPLGVPDLVAVLDQLVADLDADDLPGVSTRVGELDAHLDNIGAVRGRGGATVNRLEFIERRFEVQQIALSRQVSDIENVNMADAITRLKNEESMLRAALAVGSRILPVSLVDFLR